MSEDKELEKIKERMLRRMMAPPDTGPWTDGSVVTLDGRGFDAALGKASKPVLIDFWADWCAPCRMIKPVFDALARDFSGRAYFAKLNVDENQMLARRYGVMSIPNFVLFMKGRPVDRIVGAVGRPHFEAVLNKHIAKT
jgi:thioredoxin 1